MPQTLKIVLERPIDDIEPAGDTPALSAIIDYVPALSPLLDFCAADPIEIAQEVGMVDPSDVDDLAELREIDFDRGEWFEASAGLGVVRKALKALNDDPDLISRSLYDPGLSQQKVIDELGEIERTLLMAQQHERRFQFKLTA